MPRRHGHGHSDARPARVCTDDASEVSSARTRPADSQADSEPERNVSKFIKTFLLIHHRDCSLMRVALNRTATAECSLVPRTRGQAAVTVPGRGALRLVSL